MLEGVDGYAYQHRGIRAILTQFRVPGNRALDGRSAESVVTLIVPLPGNKRKMFALPSFYLGFLYFSWLIVSYIGC